MTSHEPESVRPKGLEPLTFWFVAAERIWHSGYCVNGKHDACEIDGCECACHDPIDSAFWGIVEQLHEVTA